MILSIDLGSTSFKAAVFDSDLNMLGEGRALLQYRFDGGGIVELGVAHAEQSFRSAVGSALAQSRVRASEIRGVGVTSQAQTFTVGPEKGSPKIPFVSWQDTRSLQAPCVPWPDFGSHCGFHEQIPGLLVSKLLYLQNQTGQELIGPADRVWLLPTWFVWKLTGKAVADDNLAGMSGLYSLVHGGWWPEALTRCGLTTAHLPALAPPASVAAYTAEAAVDWGLPSGIPVVLAGNDQTAGAWGADLHVNRAVLITLGTAQVAYRCLDSLPAPAEGCLRGTYGDGCAFQMAADDCGCAVVEWAKDLLACGSGDAFFDMASGAPRGCDGLVFDPDLGTGRGAWRGIGRNHTPAHFARSVIESLVSRMNGMVRRISGPGGPARVLVAGGGSRHALWVDLLSEALGVSVTRSSATPLLGAAIMTERTLRNPGKHAADERVNPRRAGAQPPERRVCGKQ